MLFNNVFVQCRMCFSLSDHIVNGLSIRCVVHILWCPLVVCCILLAGCVAHMLVGGTHVAHVVGLLVGGTSVVVDVAVVVAGIAG